MIKSGMANVIDDTSEIFWLISNSGGMDDTDLAQLIQRIKTTHAAVADTDGGGSVDAKVLSVPTEARQAMLELLRKDIYEDFQSLDVNTLSAAAKTTQEIQAAYQSMDNKCADFEYSVLDFVKNILDLAGIKDEPSLVWNKVVNEKEQTEMILSAAQYLTDEIIVRKLPFLTPEEAEEIIAQRDADQQDQFTQIDRETEQKEETPTEEVDESAAETDEGEEQNKE